MISAKHDNIQGPAALQASALQAATPIILALEECDEALRDEALALFKQLAGDELDREQRIATTTLLAEILFPNADHNGIPGLDLVEAEAIAPTVAPQAKGILDQMDKEEAFFAQQVQKFMMERGWTQAELAEKVGLGQPAISMMLNRSCRPQQKTVLRFAQAFGVSQTNLWPVGDTAETDELSLRNALMDVQPEEQTMQSTRDYTKFDVTIDGVTEECLPKRKAIWRVVKHLVATGVTPEDISARLPWRGKRLWKSLEGKVGTAEFVALVGRNDPHFNAERYFCQRDTDLLFVNGKTFAFSNQWGPRTQEAIQRLLTAFPNRGVSFEPTTT